MFAKIDLMKGIDKYQLVTFVLSLSVLVSLGYFIYSIYTGEFGKITLRIDVANDNNAKAIVNTISYDVPVSISDFEPNTLLDVKVIGKDNEFSGKYQAATNTAIVLKRDLGVSDDFSSGQSIWYEKENRNIKSLNIRSENNTSFDVYIDEQFIGTTPVYLEESSIPTKNDDSQYSISFRQEGHEEQSVKVELLENHSLNISVNMFLVPIPRDIGLLNSLPDGVFFLDFTNNQILNSSNKQDWAKAINYWFETRGDFISGNIRLSQIAYFIDNQGIVYNAAGSIVNNSDLRLVRDDKIVYLGDATETGVSESAEKALGDFFDSDILSESVTTVLITPNSVGFLRVREQPTTSSKELAKVEINNSYPFIDEDKGWFKIEYVEGKEGWVSGIYSEKISSSPESEEDLENNDEVVETSESENAE